MVFIGNEMDSFFLWFANDFSAVANRRTFHFPTILYNNSFSGSILLPKNVSKGASHWNKCVQTNEMLCWKLWLVIASKWLAHHSLNSTMNIKSHCKIDRYEKAKCAKSSVVEQKIKDLVNLDLGGTQKRLSQYFHGKTLKKK